MSKKEIARKNGRRTTYAENRDTESMKEIVDTIDPTNALAHVDPDKDPMYGLTDTQRSIFRLKLRGMSQGQIARFHNISQPAVSMQLKRIREHMASRGAYINPDVMVGETATFYEEVEHKAWEIFQSSEEGGDKIKALQTVMAAREKHMKLLMDLGRVERVGNKNTIEVTVSPLVEKWSSGEAQGAVTKIIEAQLSELEAPQPPQLQEYNESSQEMDTGDAFEED